MGFLRESVGAVVKTVTLPVAVVKDTANLIKGDEIKETEEQVEGIVESVIQSWDDLCDLDFF